MVMYCLWTCIPYFTKQLEQCQNKEKALHQSLKTLKDTFTELKHDTQRDVTRFTDERVKLFEQVNFLQSSYRSNMAGTITD